MIIDLLFRLGVAEAERVALRKSQCKARNEMENVRTVLREEKRESVVERGSINGK